MSLQAISKIENSLIDRQAVGPSVLRLALGGVFLAHGYLGAFVFTPAGLTAFLAGVGYPAPALFAWLLIFAHFGGGAMILAGLYTRLNGILHFLLMAIAMLTVHIKQGFFMSAVVVDAGAGRAIVTGFEYSLLLTVASLALAFVGPGRFALDNLRRAPAAAPSFA